MQNYIRQMRERRGLTLENVADSLECTKAQLSKLERGHIRLSDEWLDRLSRLFACSVHDLIDDDVQLSSEKEGVADSKSFATARLIGSVDSMQVGEVEYYTVDKQYPIHFQPPSSLLKCKTRISYQALTVLGDVFPSYPQGSQLIFVSATKETQLLIKEHSVVLCAMKSPLGAETSEAIRVIEYDELGLPYAVFKKRKSRQHLSTLAKNLLLGEVTASEKLSLVAEAEIDRPYKKLKKKQVPLQNEAIEIIGVLAKVLVDKI